MRNKKKRRATKTRYGYYFFGVDQQQLKTKLIFSSVNEIRKKTKI